MFTKQFLRTLSILLCKAHVEICFDIYSAAHLPIQSGGILNASIYPNPAKSPVGHTAVLRAAATAALIQSTGPDALVPSISSKRGQVVLLVPVFIFQRPPHCCIPALLLHVYIKTSGRAVSSLSLSHEQSRWRRHYRAGKVRHPQTTPTRMREVPKNITGRTDVRAAGYFYSL